MSNENVIKKFLEKEQAKTPLRTIINGYYSYKGRTLWTRENELINYSTRIAYIEGSNVYINVKKYSNTTRKIQNTLKQLASLTSYNIIEYQE